MSLAFKCDKCGTLYEKNEQSISIPFNRTKLGQTYITIEVGHAHTLCRECTEVALDQALDVLQEKSK